MMDWYLWGVAGERLMLAGLIALVWLAACLYWLRPLRGSSAGNANIIIAHASQTGSAQAFAETMKAALDARSMASALIPLGALSQNHLATARRLVIIASTTGIGEAPDGARKIEKQLRSLGLTLPDLDVFILALGDRSYEHFCGFGLRLADWAKSTGARTELVTVDNRSPEDLARWDSLMAHHGLPALLDQPAGAIDEWTIETREIVAMGDGEPIKASRAGPLYRVRLKPKSGNMPQFSVGDLFEWHGSDGAVRDFSIASLPTDRTLDLYVRRVELRGGGAGRASSVFASDTAVTEVKGRIRPFEVFYECEGQGPLLAIAAGSGWGGIRAHVARAIDRKRPVWLIYGERGPDVDQRIFGEMRKWHEAGEISRLDIALSRPAKAEGDKTPLHVQDHVAKAAAEIMGFLGSDGGVAICGAAGMGSAVTQEIEATLGADWIESARLSGRWRCATY